MDAENNISKLTCFVCTEQMKSVEKKKNKILNYAILDINTVEKVRARESKKGNTISS